MKASDLTYICTRDTPYCNTGDVLIIYPTYVLMRDDIYTNVTNTGYLLDDEYKKDHFKKLRV